MSTRAFWLMATVLLMGGSAEAGEGVGRDFGTAGVFMHGATPACIEEDPDTAHERCMPQRPSADAPTQAASRAFIERAAVLIHLARWREAQREIDAARVADPASVEAAHLAARVAITAYMDGYVPSWMAAARSSVDAAVALAPDNGDVRATEAFLIQIEGREEDAIAAYGRALTLNSDQAFALWQRAMLQAAKGRNRLALADYERAIRSAPRASHLRHSRADLLISLDENKAALDDLDAAIEVDKLDFHAYVKRAGVHQRLGASEAALRDLTTVVFGPKDGMPFATGDEQLAGFLMQRAMVLSDLRRHAEAAADMLRALQLAGKQGILRLQIYLRRHGHGLPVDGIASEALNAAVESCFKVASCRRGMTRQT